MMPIDTSEVRSRITKLLAAHATSFWLKTALSSALARDPIDVAKDAEILSEILTERADAILRESGPAS
jgi:hypothetical protein